MNTAGLRIGSLAGAPVVLAPSFLLLAVMIAVINAPSQAELGAFGPAAWALPVGYVAILFFAVLCHELAHGLAGLATGQRPHEIVVNLWGGHTSFSATETRAGRSALIAAVGPTTNLALAGVGWLVLRSTATELSIGQQLLVSFVFVNVLLGVFNLLPGFPLDGGQILASIVWALTGSRARGYLVAGWAGRVIAVLSVVLAAWLLLRTGSGLLLLVWAGFIGFSLWQAASTVLASARVQSRAEQVDLRPLVRPAAVVPAGSTVQQLLLTLSQSPDEAYVAVVVAGNGPIGVVEPAGLAGIEADAYSRVLVDAVAAPHNPADVVDLSVTGPRLLARIGQLRSDQVVALDGDRIVGVISGDALHAALIGR